MAQILNSVASLVSGSSTKRVYYEFETEADKSDWQVRQMTVREAISGIYTASVDLACADLSADPSALVGHNCVVKFERDTQVERLCGIISAVQNGGQNERQLLANVRIVPALYALTQRIDSRVFQELTTVEIIEEVLNGAFADYGRKFTNKLTGPYAKREYTVQYCESDFDFVSRLMQYEGISYFFDHQGEVEELILVDSNDQYPKTETYDGDPVPFIPRRSELTTAESVESFSLQSQTTPTSVTVRDFDWTRPSLSVETAQPSQDAQGRERQIYELHDLNIGGYSAEAYHEIDNDNQAVLRNQEFVARQRVFSGSGFVTALRAGEVFELTDHPVSGFDGQYLLVEVTHTRPLTDEADNERSNALESYENQFECIVFDDKIPFRPARGVRKPHIVGIQTAIVVGPAGEEVYTDEHGRIKVQFHWDRLGNRDDHSSCWVRVAQAWAGPGYGTLFIPRIGMEVLVTFVTGDPDRPLVIGCVYNGENRTGVDLEQPKYKTRSAIRTASSPGAKGYNELRFEDAADAEEIFVHAQKDYNEVVEHDHQTQVKHNQANEVKANQTESVGGAQSLTVGGNRTKTVKQDETVTVEKNRTETVKQNETIAIEGERSETVTKKQTIELKDAQEVTIAGKDALTVNNDKADHVTGNYTVDADTQFKLTQGATTMTFEGNHVQIDAASFIKAVHGVGSFEIAEDGSITVSSATSITLKVGGSQVVLSPTGIAISGMQAQMAGQMGAIAVDAAGGKLSGPTVTVEGQMMTEIKGAMVKIN